MTKMEKPTAVEALQDLKKTIEVMDFDFNDYYDHTDSIIAMLSEVINQKIKEIEE